MTAPVSPAPMAIPRQAAPGILSLQAALLNVTDVDRSIAFYQDVLGLAVASHEGQVAALMVSTRDRRQVLVLREIRSSTRGGRNNAGVRVLGFEAGTPEELQAIEDRLVARNAFVARRRTPAWDSVVGLDHDRIRMWISLGLHGGPIRASDWTHLDDAVYRVE